jgi:hypothetical protein
LGSLSLTWLPPKRWAPKISTLGRYARGLGRAMHHAGHESAQGSVRAMPHVRRWRTHGAVPEPARWPRPPHVSSLRLHARCSEELRRICWI